MRPPMGAGGLLWALLIGLILREWSVHALEALVRSPARRGLGVGQPFSEDTLGYFTERLDPGPLRQAMASTVRRAKRTKAFAGTPWIGLAVDGTGAGRAREAHCGLCHPIRDEQGRVHGHRHHRCLVSVVGTGLVLPGDLEPYPPGDSEYGAGQRGLARVVRALGRRVAQYVVVDGEFATAPFLHLAGALGLRVVARLKGNLPELFAAAQARFTAQPPTATWEDGRERVEVWDADDFDPWETLRWPTVRVLRYRQPKADGTGVEAYGLTDWPTRQEGSRALYRMAKSRWEIETQGVNDAKTRYGLEPLSHHPPNSLLVRWLLILLALTIERLYRLRYLHRGRQTPHTAIELVRLLRLALGPPRPPDTS